jgi:hypothetical protein
VLANERTGTGTYSTTNGSTNNRVTGNLTNDTTQYSATYSSDTGSLLHVVTTCEHHAQAKCQ